MFIGGYSFVANGESNHVWTLKSDRATKEAPKHQEVAQELHE